MKLLSQVIHKKNEDRGEYLKLIMYVHFIHLLTAKNILDWSFEFGIGAKISLQNSKH